jgi:outer membrane protein, multidrug efflux system
MRKNAMVVGTCAVLVGCNLAPRYERPIAPIYDSYAAAPVSDGRLAEQLSWSEFFGDPRLVAYIGAAMANNRDLAAAVARIAQARAQFRIQNSERWPQIDADVSASRSRSPLNALGLGTAAGANVTPFNQYATTIAVTAFELDFWGRVRNLTEAARRQYLATAEAQRAFALSLISEVAATYYAIRAGEEGIDLAQRTLASRVQSLEIARVRLDAGVTSTIDYDQAVVLVTQAQTQLAELQRTTEQARNQLLVLTGGPFEGALPSGRPIEDPGQFEAIDAGLPSSLLVHRPDVIAAEQNLRAANANIGAARAAYFPTISLTGTFGYISTELNDLFDSDARSWSYGDDATLPLFTAGARRARVELAQSERDELVASYQSTVQTAFREVSDALVGRQRYQEQIRAQEQAISALRRLAETAEVRYRTGVVIYLEVLDSQRNLFSAEQEMLQLRAAALQNNVTLYTALGGGLNER